MAATPEPTPEETGAVDDAECPQRGGLRCRCGKCARCGHPKHTAIHGPLYGQPPGSKPYGCRYEPEEVRE